MLTDDQLAALRRRRARRARVTAALTTLPVAAAAIATSFAVQAAIVVAAVTILAGNAPSPALDAVSPALDAVPASTILFTQLTRANSAVVDRTWASGQQMRIERFRAGQLVFESGSTGTSTSTSIWVNYRDRTWTRSTESVGPLSATAPAMSCANAGDQPIFSNPTGMAAELRTTVSCGLLKADGTATAGGVTAIRLIMPADGGFATTWYVSPATYLPIRETVTRRGTLLWTFDFQWLPPTPANLAKLSLPIPPAGFTQIK
jgi:hypothetical protein